MVRPLEKPLGSEEQTEACKRASDTTLYIELFYIF